MAAVPIPNPDVPFLDNFGRVSKPWFDFLNSVDGLRVTDLRDIAPAITPSDGDTVRYVAADKNWQYGA